MRAIYYNVNPLGWITCKWLRHIWPGCLLSSLNGLTLRDTERPSLPGDDWTLVRTAMGGICGTDLALLAQKQPPDSILQAFGSMPMGFGHENVAVVEEVGSAVDPSWRGRRVCVEPTLCCTVRGIDPPCPRCAAGQFGACEKFADPATGAAGLPPGTSIGYNAATGGAYGEFFLAHESQLVGVPDELSDEQAVLTDPLACSLHAVMRTDVSQARRVLVYGAGVLGLGVTTALRAIGYRGRIDVLDIQSYLQPLARAFGADDFLILPRRTSERFAFIAERTGGTVQRARFGNYMLSGGYDVTFDCVGAVASLNESLRWTRSRGQMMMVGTGHGRGVDLTPVWFTELNMLGAYGRQIENYDGRRVGTYQLVHDFMRDGKLQTDGMLTHTFALGDYKKAFATAMHKAAHLALKVALDFRN